MKGYQHNSDSFNQLLIKLDKLGAKARFINHIVCKGITSSKIDSIRKSTRSPDHIILGAFLWGQTPEDFDYWREICHEVSQHV